MKSSALSLDAITNHSAGSNDCQASGKKKIKIKIKRRAGDGGGWCAHRLMGAKGQECCCALPWYYNWVAVGNAFHVSGFLFLLPPFVCDLFRAGLSLTTCLYSD